MFPAGCRFKVTPGVDEFLLLACDGVWEMMDTTQGVHRKHVCIVTRQNRRLLVDLDTVVPMTLDHGASVPSYRTAFCFVFSARSHILFYFCIRDDEGVMTSTLNGPAAPTLMA